MVRFVLVFGVRFTFTVTFSIKVKCGFRVGVG